MFTKILSLLLVFLTASISIVAQQDAEAAASSNLTSVSLPVGAQRLHPESVPAEINQMLEKISATDSASKQARGASEILVWSGKGFQKKRAPLTIDRFRETLAFAGWKYEAEGESNDIVFFTLLKGGAERRAVVGFYGATEEALVIAMTEVLAAKSSASKAAKTLEKNSESQTPTGNSIVGIWRTGSMSMLQDRNTVTGATTPSNGSNLKFIFHPGGRFEFVGYMQSTMYGCTTDLFNDKQGRYEISGDSITLVLSKNYWKNNYSCSPRSNKERNYTLDSEIYTLAFKTDEYGKQNICLTNAKGETCYRREKE